MADTVTCLVTHEPPVAVVRVAGVLTLASAATLRAAVFKCLAGSPDAVVLDVGGLAVGDDLAVTVFATVVRHAEAWPAVPVLVCAPQPVLADALVRLGIDRYVTTYPGLAQARAHTTRQAPPTRVRDRLPPAASSVTAARRLVCDACAGWHLPHLADTAGLVMTELATNAVLHARTAVEITVTRGRRHLHLAVRDYSRRPPRLRGPDGETEPGGRGLLIVDTVASHWGHLPTADGKVVWATLPTTAHRR